jgi:hypothetical protein
MSSPHHNDPPTALRRIAVYVNEPKEEWFQWVLIEQRNEPPEWVEIDAAEEWFKTYRQAMAAGLLALQGLIENLDAGPRQEAEPALAPPASDWPYGFGKTI